MLLSQINGSWVASPRSQSPEVALDHPEETKFRKKTAKDYFDCIGLPERTQIRTILQLFKTVIKDLKPNRVVQKWFGCVWFQGSILNLSKIIKWILSGFIFIPRDKGDFPKLIKKLKWYFCNLSLGRQTKCPDLRLGGVENLCRCWFGFVWEGG